MKLQKKSISVAPVAPKMVLVLRSCTADLTSHKGFKWPESGPISAPDWEPTPKCGNGLHGWLWGEGDGSVGNYDPDAKWLVVSVEESLLIDLGGKVKYPSGEVVFCGDRFAAAKYVMENGGAGRKVISGTATAGDRGTATAGDSGTATAGYRGTATAGIRGTATAGYSGVISVLHWNGKRYKAKVATVKDEDGDGQLEPNVKYRLNDKGEFEVAK